MAVKSKDFTDTIFLGELSLDGNINEVNGVLPMIISMRELNIKRGIIPYNNRNECGFISDIEIVPVNSLKETIDYLNEQIEITPITEEE